MALLQYIKMDLLEWKSLLFFVGAVMITGGAMNIYNNEFIMGVSILMGVFLMIKGLK